VTRKIRDDAYNGEFDSILTDERLEMAGVDVDLKEAAFLCFPGSVLRESQCGMLMKYLGIILSSLY